MVITQILLILLCVTYLPNWKNADCQLEVSENKEAIFSPILVCGPHIKNPTIWLCGLTGGFWLTCYSSCLYYRKESLAQSKFSSKCGEWWLIWVLKIWMLILSMPLSHHNTWRHLTILIQVFSGYHTWCYVYYFV